MTKLNNDANPVLFHLVTKLYSDNEDPLLTFSTDEALQEMMQILYCFILVTKRYSDNEAL